jgi:uncharacterized protein YkwD
MLQSASITPALAVLQVFPDDIQQRFLTSKTCDRPSNNSSNSSAQQTHGNKRTTSVALDSSPTSSLAAMSDPIAVVIKRTNAARAIQGLRPLYNSPNLQAAAMAYAMTMAQANHFDHTGPDGSTVGTRAKDVGYSYKGIAENIGRGYSSGEEAVQGWLNSPGHYNNIMGDYHHIGVGFQKDMHGPGFMWVLMFGSPRNL